jgi:ABC-type bacteriocin/lantibiotic exporter with double-glycine peptidase domain
MILEKCSELSLSHFEDSEIYNQITRLESEINYKPYQTFQALITLISACIAFISSAIILFIWNPWVSFVICILPFISVYYYLKIGKKDFEMHYERSNKEREAWYVSYLLTHDFAYKEIHMFNLKNTFLKRFWGIKQKFIYQENNINKKKMILSSVFELFQEICVGFVIFFAVKSAFYGGLLIGHVATYIRAISLIQSNTDQIVNSIYSIYNSNLYMDLLTSFNEIPVDEKKEGIEITKITSIEFKNVSFKYAEDNNVLNNVSFKVNKGERVAIIGKNGSGKSTLLKLICGLYTVNEGQILVNGINLNDINKNIFNQNISVLFQDFLKYEMTLKENVVLNQTATSNDAEIYDALRLADVNFLQNEDQTKFNLDVQLGNWFDDGVQLSGGQWQKIALARAYYRQASLYLLDEPSSALDASAEINIFRTFYNMSNEKIGIFITHKVNAAKKADKIIVLDKGEIVSIGSDFTLSKQCPVYSELKSKENYVYEG